MQNESYNACTESTMAAVTADGNNHISGLSYDASGNTLGDGINAYTWDGESQLKTAGGVTYNYDGDGRRAAKVGSKLYWYGSGGEILAETDAAGNKLNEYVFFGGKRIALVPASGSALYYAEDNLGSSRVMVQANGTLCYDADFTPFGGEKTQIATCAQNYKFEGKERDTETGNDDFGARYYSWRLGRWLSSDWSAVPVPVPYANLTNPQTLNLYAMVADDPESFADLDGHKGEVPSSPTGTDDSGQEGDCKKASKPSSCSDNSAKNTVTIISTETTVTKDADGNVTKVVSTTTSATFSTAKDNTGKFLRATTSTTTVTGNMETGPVKVEGTGQKDISFAQATRAMGADRMAEGVAAALPSFAGQFARAVGRDLYHHPFRAIGRAIFITGLTIDPPTSALGVGLALGAAGADLGESVQHAREEQ